MRTGIQSLGVTFTVVALVGCASSSSELRVEEGECGDVFGANVCTWATLNDADSVIEFGATIPMAAIEAAPHDMEMTWPPTVSAVIRTPAAVSAARGIDHLTVYWEPHGHPPGPYLTPHFDFHFYSISSETREAIDCVDLTKPATVPAGYGMIDVDIPDLGMLVGLCVPEMGMHALLESEMSGDNLFDGTMVIGYDKGEPLFFEPMIARDMLMRRQSFELPMPTVPGLPDGVRYPATYRAEYDAATDAYRFTFSGG